MKRKNAARCKKYIKTDKICSALQIFPKSFVYLQRTAFLFFKTLKVYDRNFEDLFGLYNTIVLKDVVSRRKITDVMMLQSVVRFLADNIGNIFLCKKNIIARVSTGKNKI